MRDLRAFLGEVFAPYRCVSWLVRGFGSTLLLGVPLMQVRSSLSVLLVLAVLVLASPAFLSDGRAPIGEGPGALEGGR